MTDIFNVNNPAIGKTTRILNFLNSSPNFFISIGKSTSWTGTNVSDSNPPIPSHTLTSIIEPIIYKRVQKIIPALYSTSCSNLDFDLDYNEVLYTDNITDKTYNLIEPHNLYDKNNNLISFPNLLYVSANIDSTDYPAPSFRTIGFFTNVEFIDGVNLNKIIYEPNEIKSAGILHWVSYSTPVLRQDGKTHYIEFLLDL